MPMGPSHMISLDQVGLCLCSFIAKTPKIARFFYQLYPGGKRLIEIGLLAGRKGSAQSFFGEVVPQDAIFRGKMGGSVQ